MSSYFSENIFPEVTHTSNKLFKTFPFLDINCIDTRRNTKFNYLDTELNPTNIEEGLPTMDCNYRACRIFNHSQVKENKLFA